jgi:hypothetical protein
VGQRPHSTGPIGLCDRGYGAPTKYYLKVGRGVRPDGPSPLGPGPSTKKAGERQLPSSPALCEADWKEVTMLSVQLDSGPADYVS